MIHRENYYKEEVSGLLRKDLKDNLSESMHLENFQYLPEATCQTNLCCPSDPSFLYVIFCHSDKPF